MSKAERSDLDKQSIETLRRFSAAYMATHDFERAWAVLQVITKRDTTHLESLLDMAAVADEMGLTDSVVEALERASSVDTLDRYVSHRLAQAYMSSERWGEALATSERLLAADSTDAKAWGVSGQCYQGIAMNGQSMDCYMRALNLDRENSFHAIRFLSILSKIGLPTEFFAHAVSMCQEAMRANPRDRRLARLVGQYAFLAGLAPKADTIFMELLAQGDSSFVTLKYGGLTAQSVDNNGYRAHDLLLLAHQIDTTDVVTLLSLAQARYAIGHAKLAASDLDRLQKLISPDPYLLIKIELLSADIAGRTGAPSGAVIEHRYKAYNMMDRGLQKANLLAKIYKDLQIKREISERETQQLLFVSYLLATHHVLRGELTSFAPLLQTTLRKAVEDSFFRGADQATMRSPDGKTSNISHDKINELIEQLRAVQSQ